MLAFYISELSSLWFMVIQTVLGVSSIVWIWPQSNQTLVDYSYKFFATIALAYLAGIIGHRFCGWVSVSISHLGACRLPSHRKDTKLCGWGAHQLHLDFSMFIELCGSCPGSGALQSLQRGSHCLSNPWIVWGCLWYPAGQPFIWMTPSPSPGRVL